MQPVYQSKSFIKGALILTVAALVTKILSAVYRIPFQNMVGDVGFYIYQQVYPIYGVALVLSTTGFPVILSKLLAEKKNKEGDQGVGRVLVIAAVFLLILGILLFSILYGGADWIARQMNDPELAVLIRVISIVFLIFPFTALLRGYFQGKGYMLPTALSQVGEQLVRVGTILTVAYLFVQTNYSLYEVGGGAVFGSVTGGLIAAFILIAFIWGRKEIRKIHISRFSRTFRWQETGGLIKTLLFQGFAICVSSMILILMQLADSLNLFSLLITSGMEGEHAKAAKGIYDRGQPLVQLGAVVATSMSLSLVPLIASEKFRNDTKALIEKIDLAIRVSATIGLGAAIGLISIIHSTNIMLFENSEGSNILAVLSVTIFISSIIITLIAILQGLGYTVFPAVIVLIGFGVKYLLNQFLVPIYGPIGAAFASIGSLALILLILIYKLIRTLKAPILSWSFLVKIFSAAIVMFLLLKAFVFMTDIIYAHGSIRLAASIQSLTGVMVGGLIYMVLVIRTRVFSMEELSLLPFGSKFMYLFPNKNRR